MSQRVQFILIGLLGGFAFWGLFDHFPMLEQARVALPLVVLAGAFFFAALAMAADLGLRRAVLFALPIAAVAAGLTALEGLGFATPDQMLNTGHLVVAMGVLAAMPVPFAVALGLGGRAGLTDYRVLFTESWNIVVRYVSAWLFVGVAMVVLYLSAELLDLVGVHLLRDLLREDLPMWLILGGTLGLGFSVVTELADTVSPYLLLRLLRLLAPFVLLVEAVFVVAVPMRGLSALFGDLSVASALLATAVASIALISIVVDEDDVEAAQGGVLSGSARGLMALLPVLTGLAIWALVLRVGQYGWTPGRVAAVALAGVVAGYALCYLVALSMGRHWRDKVRQGNVAMALAIIGLAVLWLTPVLSPEAIAVRSQMARFGAGQASVAQLPLWEMKHDWGRAGLVALERLAVAAEDRPDLAKRLAQLETADSRWALERQTMTVPEDQVAALRRAVHVLPAGAAVPDALWREMARMGAMVGGRCDSPYGPELPSCVVLMADLSPGTAGPEAVFFNARLGYGPPIVYARLADGWHAREVATLQAGATLSGEALVRALMSGAVAPSAMTVTALPVGDQIFILPR